MKKHQNVTVFALLGKGGFNVGTAWQDRFIKEFWHIFQRLVLVIDSSVSFKDDDSMRVVTVFSVGVKSPNAALSVPDLDDAVLAAEGRQVFVVGSREFCLKAASIAERACIIFVDGEDAAFVRLSAELGVNKLKLIGTKNEEGVTQTSWSVPVKVKKFVPGGYRNFLASTMEEFVSRNLDVRFKVFAKTRWVRIFGDTQEPGTLPPDIEDESDGGLEEVLAYKILGFGAEPLVAEVEKNQAQIDAPMPPICNCSDDLDQLCCNQLAWTIINARRTRHRQKRRDKTMLPPQQLDIFAT